MKKSSYSMHTLHDLMRTSTSVRLFTFNNPMKDIKLILEMLVLLTLSLVSTIVMIGIYALMIAIPITIIV